MELARKMGSSKESWEVLLQNLNGNVEKAHRVVSSFIEETPLLFDQALRLTQGGQVAEAAAIIHKMKARFGYFGLSDMSEALDSLEIQLQSNRSTADVTRHIIRLAEQTLLVIDELKKSKFLTAPLQKLNLTGKHVLIAEDDTINAMVFDLFVKEAGAHSILAKDGLQAVKFAVEQKPDIIFMDVNMPFFSGLDAIRELRAQGIRCPIISLSASTRLHEKQNSMEAGANDFLVKPASRESINLMLMKYL